MEAQLGLWLEAVVASFREGRDANLVGATKKPQWRCIGGFRRCKFAVAVGRGTEVDSGGRT